MDTGFLFGSGLYPLFLEVNSYAGYRDSEKNRPQMLLIFQNWEIKINSALH